MARSDPEQRRHWRRIRNRVNSMWADEDPPTLIDGPPPLGLWSPQQPLPAPADVVQQRSFDFAQRVGAIMLARGAPVDDVEASVRAAALAMGLPSPEVDVTFTSIVVSVRPDPDRAPLTSVGVVHQRSDDHSRLVATHRLLLALTSGRLSREEAFRRLTAIEDSRHAYGRNIVTLARGVLAGTIVIQLGGGWSAALVVLAVAMVIDLIGRWLSARRVPSFYLNVVGGLVATLAAAATTALDLQETPSLVVAGSIVALLPGATLVNGVRDALTGYFVTGVARMFEMLVVVSGLVGGVALGLGISQSLDVDMSVLPDPAQLSDLPVRVVSAALAGVAAAIAYYCPARLWPAIATSAAFGMLVLALVQQTGAAQVATYPLAAFVVGLSGYAFANLQKALPVMTVVPGIMSLLPGLTIYSGLLQLVSGDPTGGMVSFVDAGARGLSIAAAVLAAELIGAPLRSRVARYLQA